MKQGVSSLVPSHDVSNDLHLCGFYRYVLFLAWFQLESSFVLKAQ